MNKGFKATGDKSHKNNKPEKEAKTDINILLNKKDPSNSDIMQVLKELLK